MAQRVEVVNEPTIDMGIMGFVFFLAFILIGTEVGEIKDELEITNAKLERLITIMEQESVE